jgi:RimJ/RimL family protein N-acetyltransferase
MKLRGDDIVLRPFVSTDVASLVDALADEEIARWIPLIPVPYTPSDADSWLERCREVWQRSESYPFAIVGSETGELLGSIEAHADNGTIGYWVAAHRRGRGIATQALKLICEWNRRRPLWLTTHPDNVASQRVAEKAGFRRVGMRPHEPAFRDGTTEAVLFELP